MDDAPDARADSRVLEWFRSEPRQSLHAALLPALLCATAGWLVLTIAGRVVAARPPHPAPPLRSTLPAASVVDADGDPVGAGTLRPADRGALLAGTLLVMVSPLVLVARLRNRSRSHAAELLLRVDGLVLRAGGGETAVKWSVIGEVRVDRPPGGEPARVVLAHHDGRELELDARFVGVTTEELAARIRAIRGRALFGLLEPAPWPERAPER